VQEFRAPLLCLRMAAGGGSTQNAYARFTLYKIVQTPRWVGVDAFWRFLGFS
jgi:hypothetical protein